MKGKEEQMTFKERPCKRCGKPTLSYDKCWDCHTMYRAKHRKA